MGAWGHRHYENDSALDFAAEVEESTNPKEIFANVFASVIESDYLDSEDAAAAIVSATYVDSQVNGTKFSGAESTELLEVDTFGVRHPNVDLADLQTKAVDALNKVLGDESELNELWLENEKDYPSWRHEVEQLIKRLTK